MTDIVNFQTIDKQLNFETSVFPSVIKKPEQANSLGESIDWLKKNIHQIEAELESSGAVLFRGFPIDDAQTFDAFSAAFNYKSFTYQESFSNAVRVNFTERVFTANEAPKDVEIYLHHEMAQTPVSPDKLFFFCKAAADFGGETPICRSDKLYEALKKLAPELVQDFLEKGVKYTTYMPNEDNHESGQGRSWKNTLSVNNKKEAETRLIELGYSWQWVDDNSLKAITPILPAIKKLDNGIHTFYNQLIAAYLGWKGVKEDPSIAITFGDQSHIAPESLELIVQLSKQFTFDLAWQDGDMVLVDNKMTMHGRRSYSGEKKRQVLVALAS